MLHRSGLGSRQQGSVAAPHAATAMQAMHAQRPMPVQPARPGTSQTLRSWLPRNVAAKWAKDQTHEILSALHPAEVPGYQSPAESPELEQVGAQVERKLIDIQDALKLLRDNQLLVTSMGPAEPRLLHEYIHDRAVQVKGLTMYGSVVTAAYPMFTYHDLEGHMEARLFFLSRSLMGVLKDSRHVNYVPGHFSGWMRSVRASREYQRQGGIDVVWGTCSLPDARGFVSLGTGSDIITECLAEAKTVILEINPHMPCTYGSTLVPIDKVTHFLYCNKPLPETGKGKAEAPLEEEDMRIAQRVGELVPDGATLQIGIGNFAQSLTPVLKHKKDLGIHSEMLHDCMVDLVHSGAVNNSRKTLWPYRTVGTFAMGSRKLFDFMHKNPLVELHPATQINSPTLMAQNHKMHSINTAIEVDITGQVCSEALGYSEISGVGGANDTHTGASLSEGGRGIIAIRSLAPKGQSKIVLDLTKGARVTIGRNDVDTVVTEWGVAQLKDKTVRQRAMEMISIAHPNVREQLLEEARKVGFI